MRDVAMGHTSVRKRRVLTSLASGILAAALYVALVVLRSPTTVQSRTIEIAAIGIGFAAISWYRTRPSNGNARTGTDT